ncbi:MAG: hypothetical protein CISAcid_10690 [uncultured Acidilobus sp. CIS]|nr:MAG: hypothetical protein CISAcid_10690 [uncultured Acidilobus sp. CIS]
MPMRTSIGLSAAVRKLSPAEVLK